MKYVKIKIEFVQWTQQASVHFKSKRIEEKYWNCNFFWRDSREEKTNIYSTDKLIVCISCVFRKVFSPFILTNTSILKINFIMNIIELKYYEILWNK